MPSTLALCNFQSARAEFGLGSNPHAKCDTCWNRGFRGDCTKKKAYPGLPACPPASRLTRYLVSSSTNELAGPGLVHLFQCVGFC